MKIMFFGVFYYKRPDPMWVAYVSHRGKSGQRSSVTIEMQITTEKKKLAWMSSDVVLLDRV